MGICIYVEERSAKSISCLGGLYFVVAETRNSDYAARLVKKFSDSADFRLVHYWDRGNESYYGGFCHFLGIISREYTPTGKSVNPPDFLYFEYRATKCIEFFLPGNNPDITKVIELVDLFFEYNTWSSLKRKVVSLEQKVIDYENLNSKMEEFGSTSRAIECENKKLEKAKDDLEKAKDDLEFYRSASDEQLNKRLIKLSLKKLYYDYKNNELFELFLTTISMLPALWVGLMLGMGLMKLIQSGY